MTRDLSIVIVTYQSRGLIGDCLRAIDRAVGGAEAEAIVVDNASPDGTADRVAEAFPRVRLIRNGENRGFAAACNQGAAVTDRPFLLLLNPDTVVQPAALDRSTALLRDQPAIGAAGCQLLYPDGSFQHSAFRFPTPAMTCLDFFPLHHRLIDSRLNGRYPRSAYRRPFPIDHPLGAFLLIRRSVWESVGPLDEGYFMYVEEIDWCRRAKAAGQAIACEPRATVIHHSGASTRQVRAPMLIELYRSRLRYFAKHLSPGEQLVHRALIAAGCTARLRSAGGDEAAAYRTIRGMCLADGGRPPRPPNTGGSLGGRSVLPGAAVDGSGGGRPPQPPNSGGSLGDRACRPDELAEGDGGAGWPARLSGAEAGDAGLPGVEGGDTSQVTRSSATGDRDGGWPTRDLAAPRTPNARRAEPEARAAASVPPRIGGTGGPPPPPTGERT